MPDKLLIPSAEAPKKLENFLKNRFPIGYVRKLFRKNGLRLNGSHPKPTDLIYPGDQLELYIPFEKKKKTVFELAASGQELKVIFEDHELLVIEKPPGIAVHEGKEILKRSSVLGIMQARYQGANVVPRLVHRLDKDTSGLLLIAKREELAKELESQFAKGKVEKEYCCLVFGRTAQNTGTIDFPLPGRKGQPVRAISEFTVTRRFSDTTLLRVRIATGRMHQIRLHLAGLGHPVVMDNQHGNFAFNKRFRKEHNLNRQFLHASRLTLSIRGKRCVWKSALPEDLARTLRSLSQREKRTFAGKSFGPDETRPR